MGVWFNTFYQKAFIESDIMAYKRYAFRRKFARALRLPLGEKINQALKVAVQLGMELLWEPMANLSYQEKIKQSYGYDPFICSHCGGQMYLWQLWVKGAGFIDLLKTSHYNRFKPPPVRPDESVKGHNESNQSTQLPLFL